MPDAREGLDPMSDPTDATPDGPEPATPPPDAPAPVGRRQSAGPIGDETARIPVEPEVRLGLRAPEAPRAMPWEAPAAAVPPPAAGAPARRRPIPPTPRRPAEREPDGRPVRGDGRLGRPAAGTGRHRHARLGHRRRSASGSAPGILDGFIGFLLLFAFGVSRSAIAAVVVGRDRGRLPDWTFLIAGLGFYFVYFVGFWTSQGKATPGMRAFKLQVANAADGKRLEIGPAVKRWLALGYVFSLIGVIPALSPLASLRDVHLVDRRCSITTSQDRMHQGLHDRWAKSRRRPTRGRRIRWWRRGRVPDHRAGHASFLVLVAIVGPDLPGSQVSGILSTVGESSDRRGQRPRPVHSGAMPHRRRTTEGSTRDQATGLTDMDPARSGAPRTRSWTSWPTTSRASSAIRSSRRSSPARSRPLFPASAPEAPEPLEAILADYVRAGRAERHALAAPGLPGLLRDDGVRAGDPRRDADRGARPEPDALADLADRDRARGGRRRLAARGAGPAGRRSTVCSPTPPRRRRSSRSAAAREALGVGAAAAGPAGSGGRRRGSASTPPSEAHSSIDKACMTLGLGRARVVHVPSTTRYAMRPDALAAAIAADRAAGHRPMADRGHDRDDVVHRGRPGRRDRRRSPSARACGSTSTRPTPGRSRSSRSVAAPFDGWERADSIVVNPHKWLFTPLDASLLLTRRMDDLRAAFSLVPEYLRTLDATTPVRDYNEYTPQLGRRFRALKLWIQLRWFGLDGLRRRIERHIELAPGVRRLGRRRPRLGAPGAGAVLDGLLPLAPGRPGRRRRRRSTRPNARIMDAVNRTGEVFLSHTRLDGRFTIRLSVGNLRTEARHVERAWALLREAAAATEMSSRSDTSDGSHGSQSR